MWSWALRTNRVQYPDPFSSLQLLVSEVEETYSVIPHGASRNYGDSHIEKNEDGSLFFRYDGCCYPVTDRHGYQLYEGRFIVLDAS